MLRHALRASQVLVSDCTTALDPELPAAVPARTARRGSGGAWCSRNTARGARPTPSSSRGSARIFNDAGVHWQTHSYKAGYGGGTIAQWFANADIDAIDVGIGILSMHSPMDVSAKVDLWELYRGFKAFLGRRAASATATTAR